MKKFLIIIVSVIIVLSILMAVIDNLGVCSNTLTPSDGILIVTERPLVIEKPHLFCLPVYAIKYPFKKFSEWNWGYELK